ncbi:MAG: serine-pyruvate transaminase [Candidatus Aramenus sulfurataquae]|jgi:aspartate aminotransferase-like enzyme|uniref:Alanine--glyoxylate aminotransferase family protein n=3 Tax=Candidatus Aramenus sulfurataquae TaxID=1326980 RepID=W7KI66_9CREN|nr:MAG: serine-pyruvate transaminase [Candidatus Aramenus sulfurataquae]MCL7344021.1 alanine--glyoxylate aminotransferase family protein [Candidatus Aramenus sulfurataquae]
MLLIPGPVNVPRSVEFEATRVVNHRSDAFREVVSQLEGKLAKLFSSDRVALLTGSGTLAVEAMVYSLLRRGEKVVVLTYGEFSERLLDSVKRRGAQPVVYRKVPGESFNVEEVKKVVEENKDASAVALVHNETSTGIAFRELRSVVKAIKDSGKKALVDSVSGFAAYELLVNEWGIDAVATGSQKALASVPGMGLVALSKEGISNLSSIDVPAFHDIQLYLKFQDKHETPFTPAVGVFFATLRAAELLEREGIKNRWARHEACARYLRKVTTEMGFSLLGNESNFSNTVVAGVPPISPKSIIAELKNRGIEISGGMGELREKIVRIGILGVVDDRAIHKLVTALSDILKQEVSLKAPSQCSLPDFLRAEVEW